MMSFGKSAGILLVIVIISIIYAGFTPLSRNKDSGLDKVLLVNSYPIFKPSTVDMDAIFYERRVRLSEQCRTHNIKKMAIEKRRTSELLVSHRLRLAYCVVPKAACSFWKALLYLLNEKHAGRRKVYELSSTRIHRILSSSSLSFSLVSKAVMKRKHIANKKIIFVRDPFVRLFSGYVDKFFLPPRPASLSHILKMRAVLKSKTGINLSETNPECFPSLTFSEFVQYAVLPGGPLATNIHFQPVHNLCLPCHLRYRFVGKLETLYRDVSFILKDVGVNPEKALGTEEEFKTNSVLTIIHDITVRSFKNWSKYPGCMSRSAMLRRIWTTFQMRGFFSIQLGFPLTEGQCKQITQQQFRAMAEKAYLKHSRSSQLRHELAHQRRQAMQAAFSSVPIELLRQLEAVVSTDCDLFGYDCSVERRFNVSDNLSKELSLYQ